MQWYEKIIYFVLFLMNKYISIELTENWLNNFENKMIRKHLEKSPVHPYTIPTIQGELLTDELFLQASDNYRRPVLIKGLMKNSKAVQKWTIDHFNAYLENFKLNVLHYTTNNNNVQKLEIKNMKYGDFVMQKDKCVYVNNNHTILCHFPELFNDIKPEYSELIQNLSSTNLKNIHIANLFIGYNNNKESSSGSNMHCGGSGNFFCMLRGTKHWTLIPPEYSCLLKGRVSPSGIHAQTLFDMPDVQISKIPEIFKFLPRYEVTLEPGDVLWNAPWWWHRIKNGSGESIGIAIRNNKVTWLNLRNNFTYTLSGYTYLLYNSLLICLYEMIIGKNANFGVSKNENSKNDVLYQINDLCAKYPRSIKLDELD